MAGAAVASATSKASSALLTEPSGVAAEMSSFHGPAWPNVSSPVCSPRVP